MISDKHIVIVFKNFKRNRMVNLTARSVLHFLPNAELHCLTMFNRSMDEYADQDPLLPCINETTAKTKYVSGLDVHDCIDSTKTSGYGSPLNGLFFTEGYNHIHEQFRDYDDKLLILAEDHFFTTGAVLRELLENEWDAAFAEWNGSPPEFRNRANGSILGIVPKRVAELFPLQERVGSIEGLLGETLLLRLPLERVYQIKHRHTGDYCGDGLLTNSSVEMQAELSKAGII